MSKENKSNNAEYKRRINELFNMLLNGLARHEILQYVSDKAKWGVDERQIDRYIFEARKLFEQYAKEDRDDFIKESKARLHDLYKLNKVKKDYKECRLCIETKNKVLGYEKLNVIMEKDLSEEDIDKLIKEKLMLLNAGKNKN